MDPRRGFEAAVGVANDGRLDQAVEMFGDIIARFGNSQDAAVKEVVAESLLNRAYVLGALGRTSESEHDYEELVEAFGGDALPDIQTLVAWGLHNEGVSRWGRRDREGALQAFRRIVKLFRRSEAPEVEERVIDALDSIVRVLDELQMEQQAVRVCDEIIQRLKRGRLGEMNEYLARALNYRGLALQRRGQFEMSLKSYDAVLAIPGDGDLTTDRIREYIAWAYANKAAALLTLRRYDEAIAQANALDARFGESGDARMRPALAAGLLNKGHALRERGQPADSLAMYEQLIREIDHQDKSLSPYLSNAYLSAGVALEDLGRLEEALGYYERLTVADLTNTEIAVTENVARGLVRRADLLGRLDRASEAARLYESVLTDFVEYSSPAIQDLTEAARKRLRLLGTASGN